MCTGNQLQYTNLSFFNQITTVEIYLFAISCGLIFVSMLRIEKLHNFNPTFFFFFFYFQ